MSMSAETLQTGQGASATCGTGSVGDYFALMKPRVMSLVVFTAFTGLVMAPGALHPWLSAMALLAIAVGAGAAGALNMWYDADIDALMARTARRPVPSGVILGGEALGFGIFLAGSAIILLGLLINWVAAGLLAFTIFFYAVIYTMWLKRSTPQNIVIGGAAGSLPPVIGWAAVTGSLDPAALTLFLIIFLWTPPHFWALALIRSKDYERARVPMLPVASGSQETRRQIVIYSMLLVGAAFLPVAVGIAGLVYGFAAAGLGVAFLWCALDVFRSREGRATHAAAGRLFGYSIVYLFLLFAMLLVEHGLGMAPLHAG